MASQEPRSGSVMGDGAKGDRSCWLESNRMRTETAWTMEVAGNLDARFQCIVGSEEA